MPAAIMSIAAANLFTRNIYKAYLKPDADRCPGGQSLQDRLVDHQVRRAALRSIPGQAERVELPAARRCVDPADAAQSIVFGLFTRWFHRWALLAGWAAGMIYGTVTAYGYCTACTTRPFANSLAVVPVLGKAGYIGLTAFVVNIVVVVLLTALLRAAQKSPMAPT